MGARDIAGVAFLVAAFAIDVMAPPVALAQDQLPERVQFPSADKRTTLVGYLYKPARGGASPSPAVVMMHGRGGAHSTLAKGVYEASTLSLRHQAWGRLWADAGYMALLVDGFGPRGYPQGFPRFSYASRPEALNEVTVRPLDAYGALAYLGSRGDVAADRVGLQGWSNGGSATIAAMAQTLAASRADSGRFRAALAFYPACGLKGAFEQAAFVPYAPTLVLHGSADEEVSTTRCARLVNASRANGGATEIVIYPGATHGFDSPGRRRQSHQPNARATDDAVERALAFFARHVLPARP